MGLYSASGGVVVANATLAKEHTTMTTAAQSVNALSTTESPSDDEIKTAEVNLRLY